MISSYDLLNEISDEKRFIKKVGGALLEVRNGVGDGLFTVSHSHIVSFMSRWGLIAGPCSGRTKLVYCSYVEHFILVNVGTNVLSRSVAYAVFRNRERTQHV